MLVLTLAVTPAFAAPAPRQVASARTEATVLPEEAATQPDGTKTHGRAGDSVDLRDSAALVLVGSMLIGLAAAVRRTA